MIQVGKLAAATGLSVRALHHYEAIGLIEPSRSETGYRQYDAADVERLYRIARLRAIGVPLEAVGRALGDEEHSIQAVLQEHADSLEADIARLTQIRTAIAGALHGDREHAADIPIDHLTEVINQMTNTADLRQRISMLVYRDLEAAHDYLVRVFGFQPGEITRHDGVAVHAEVFGADGAIWLHHESSEFGLASPATLGASTAMMAVMVADVDEHYAAVVAAGGTIAYGPVDQPYGYREYSARDLEGGLWTFMKRLDSAAGSDE